VLPCCLVPLRPKYSPQHLILENPPDYVPPLMWVTKFHTMWIIIIIVIIIIIIIFSGSAAQHGLWPPLHKWFLDHTKRRATVCRTPFGRVISSSQRPLPGNTQHQQQTPGGIRNHDRSRRADVDLWLRPRGHWDRPHNVSSLPKNKYVETNARKCWITPNLRRPTHF
jgi:hypothetical protein